MIIMISGFLFHGLRNFGQEKKPSDSLQHEVSVVLKLIQVYVSDREGNPIRDLSKDEFILFVDGRETALTDFEIHQEDPAAHPDIKAEASPRMSRKFLLLIDAFRNDGPGLKKARATALHVIDSQIRPEDELGLLTYSLDRGLVLQVPLSTQHDQVRISVQSVRLFPGITMVNNGAAAMEEAVDFTDSLRDFVISLRDIPGYKNIILFSAGLPRSLLQAEDPRLRFQHERLVRELASSSSLLYTIDTQGGRDLVQGREQRGDDSLRRLASLTGGRFFPNVDYREAISEDIRNSTGNYYVLGCPVAETRDGQYHEIRVEVRREGARVRAPKGYYNPKRYSRFTKLERRHHLLDLARNPSPRFGWPRALPGLTVSGSGPRSPSILHLTEIIPDDLEEILPGKVEMFILVFDSHGSLRAEGRTEIDLTRNPPARTAAGAWFAPPPGEYEVVAVLRNRKTGAAARSINRTVISTGEDSSAALFGPVLFLPGEAFEYLPLDLQPVKGEPGMGHLDLRALMPRMETPLAPLVRSLDRNTSTLYAVFVTGEAAENTVDRKFSFRLISRGSGTTRLLESRRRDDIRTKRKDTLIFGLDMFPVPPGEYSLEITSSGAGGRSRAEWARDLHIR